MRPAPRPPASLLNSAGQPCRCGPPGPTPCPPAPWSPQRVRTGADMCALPMLRSPAWQRRIYWVILTAEMLPFPAAPHALLDAQHGDGAGSRSVGGNTMQLQECRSFVGFFQLLLAALSVLLAAALEPPGVAEAAVGDGGGSDGGSSDAGGGSGSFGLSRRAWRRAAAAVRRGVSEAEACVAHLCHVLLGRAWPGVVQLSSWLLLLSFLWTLALFLEQQAHAALPSPPPLLPPLEPPAGP